jgi:hypothetical protein
MRYVCATIAAAACACTASADLAYDTFSAGFGYEVLAGSTVSGAQSAPGYTDTANQFTSAASGFITDIWVAVSNVAGPNAFDINLRADLAGAPGEIIHSWTLLDAAFPFDGVYHDPVHLVVADAVQLQSGVTYWLDLHATDPQSHMAWHFTSPPIFETVAQRFAPDGPWNVLTPGFTSAFAINVEVPAPGSAIVLALGIAGLGHRRPRRIA